METRAEIYGVTGEFEDEEQLLAAAHGAYEAGYRDLDAFSPFPVEGLDEAIGFRQTRLPLVILAGGIIGLSGGYMLQYYISVISYPLNVGGRPLHSWPAFIPVTFEATILVAAIFAVLGMLGLNGLPEPYHPLFNVPRFSLASQDRFFLLIEATDPQFDREEAAAFLERLGALDVSDVEP